MGDNTAKKGVGLYGRYEAASDGPVSQITFYDPTHYVMSKAGCSATDGSCDTAGTYVYDDGAHLLSLTDGASGVTTKIGFQATDGLSISDDAVAQPRSARRSTR